MKFDFTKNITLVCRVVCVALLLMLFAPFTHAQNNYQFARAFSGVGSGALNHPTDVTLDKNGNVYVTDALNQRVEKFDSSGNVVLAFGIAGVGNGKFTYPDGIAVERNGNIYVADGDNHTIQKFDSSGNFLLGIGAGYQGVGGNVGDFGSGNGQFNSCYSVATDSIGNVYVADLGNKRIQKFNSSGVYLSKFTYGTSFGPLRLCIDGSGNIYVADESNNRIVKFDSGGNFLFGIGAGYQGVGGTIGKYGSGNGQLNFPYGVTLDGSGNIYVADDNNYRIQKFDKNGVYLAKFGTKGSGNGQLQNPQGVAVDGGGNVFVADILNNRIQVFAPVGVSVSGTLAFDGLVTNAAPQFVTFTFRPNDNSGDIIRSLAVPANGVFTLNGLFSKAGILHVKGDKYLAVNVPVDLSAGNASGVTATLEPGDANNDNIINIGDFGLLVNAYGDGYDVTDPNANPSDVMADFNGDGLINIGDFGLLVNSYGDSGAL